MIIQCNGTQQIEWGTLKGYDDRNRQAMGVLAGIAEFQTNSSGL